MRNHYEILQVAPNSTLDQVKDAFRMLLYRYHPDHNRDKEDWAVQQTMQIVESYHVLSDPQRRAHYDVFRTVKPREPAEKKGGLAGLFGKGKDGASPAEATLKRALEAWKADEYEQSAVGFRKAFELDQTLPNLRYNLALAFLALDRLGDALQWLQDHAARNKEDQEARALYAKVAALLQKRRQAAPA